MTRLGDRLVLTLLGAVLAVLLAETLVLLRVQGRMEEAAHPAIDVASSAFTDGGSPASVTLAPDVQRLLGVETAQLTSVHYRSRYVAYGRLMADPSEIFVIRAPVPGILRAAGSQAWPRIGGQVRKGETAATIEPRITPAERLALESQLTTARSDLSAAGASLTAAKAAYERARTLHAQNQNVSLRDLQNAEARMKGEEARSNAAAETVRLMEAALAARSGPAAPIPLVARSGGEIVEVLGQPGESVDSGQAVLRLARFDRLLARVSLPAGEEILKPVTAARIVPVGMKGRSFRGEMVAYGSEVDPETQGLPFIFRIRTLGFPLRPGTSITAYFSPEGKAEAGVEIPGSAVLWYAGKTWAYVQSADTRFVRREVALDHPEAAGWFTATGFAPGERIVVSGAQMLLSVELSATIPGGN